MKKFLTIEEYCKKFYRDPKDKHMIEYVESLAYRKNRPEVPFPPEIYKVGMLEWNNKDADCWGGPFEENYIFCRITDHRFEYPAPKSVREINLEQEIYEEYSGYNVPLPARLRIFPYATKPHGYFIQKTWEGKECSRSMFTHAEYTLMMSELTVEEKAEREQNINYKLKAKYRWALEQPSKEFPIKIYLCGNDDCSYTRVVLNRQEAQKEFKALLSYGNNMNWIRKYYVFTN